VNPFFCSRGRRPRSLASEPVAGVADPGPRSSTAATKSAQRSWRPLALSIVVLFVVSCANFAPPPAISPRLIASAQRDHADAPQLSRGRAIFVSRCLECHTLPSVAKHSPGEWPHLVSRMAARANLSASEETAIIAYLRAASVTANTHQ
jgi:mono/diheme cytochrome c family protein